MPGCRTCGSSVWGGGVGLRPADSFLGAAVLQQRGERPVQGHGHAHAHTGEETCVRLRREGALTIKVYKNNFFCYSTVIPLMFSGYPLHRSYI